MRRLDLPLSSPAEQLAADEFILDQCEAGCGDETLIFWEPSETFIVVGYANKVFTEVNLPVCEARKIPIFRRCSGGGTVVQMPGGLNYGLILRIEESGPTRSISAANHFIMERNRRAIAELLPESEVIVRGHTDLCIGQLKFAGNSQRRRKHFLLFHGTLLLNCRLDSIGELLRMPSLEPDYRKGRAHGEFVTNLGIAVERLKSALARAWDASVEFSPVPIDEIKKIAQEKYMTADWNLKF